jgi:HEAT repeat protein
VTSAELEEFISSDDPPDGFWNWVRRSGPTRDLVTLLRTSKDPQVRYQICYIFDRRPMRSAREALVEAMFDEDVEVRKAATDAYGKVCRPEDGPIVYGAFRLETNRTARYNLILALGAVHFQRAAPALIALIDDQIFDVPAIWALGELDGPDVVAALNAALARAPDRGMVTRIQDSLDRIANRAYRSSSQANA